MEDPNAFALLGRLLPSLGLIVGALLLVRRWAQRGGGARRVAGVKVITRTALSRGAAIAVVEYDGRRFLVGAGERGVQLLSELESADAAPAPAPLLTADQDVSAPRQVVARPWTGPLDRLRGMTVRTPVQRPSLARPRA